MSLRNGDEPGRSPDPAGADAHAFVERCRRGILEIIRDRWRRYFPDLCGSSPPRVTMPREAREHGYSIIQEYAVIFDEAAVRRDVIAKVRRGALWGSVGDGGTAGKASSLARMEFEELSRAYRFFKRLGGDCQVIRPIAHLETYNAVIIEKAGGQDLGELVRRGEPGLTRQFERCGRWLRHFHIDVHSRHEEAWNLECYEDAIRHRAAALAALGVRTNLLDGLLEKILAKARAFRGCAVPASVLHGDLKLRHVWGRASGIEVLDFGNVHEGECYKDVAAFLVELLVLTLGRPLGGRPQDGYSQAFLDGYLRGEAPSLLLHHYIVESLLKKWSRRLRRWTNDPVSSLVQRGLEAIRVKNAVDRLWLDRWFRQAIEGQLALIEGRS